jgi:hypothetical protein
MYGRIESHSFGYLHFLLLPINSVLGVKKIFLLDKDTVDYHNLNRQILFSKEDIGKSKVISRVKLHD